MILSIFDWTPIQSFFLWLNKGVYWLAEKAYSLLLDIANVQLFEPEVISNFGERIYVLLGIVMLFKLSFSFITYIVNPDSFTDKSKGVSKLILNVIVALLLIVTVPFIFQAAYKLQGLILGNNVIPNLVLGMGSETDSDVNEEGYDYIEEGERMSFLVFTSFFKPNPALYDEDSVCRNTLFTSSDGEDIAVDSENNNDLLSQIGSDKLEMLEECKEPLDASTGTSFDGNISGVLALAYENSNMNLLTDTDLIKAKYGSGDNAIYTFDFMGIVSIIAAGFMAWIFIMFCFDVAVRVVKLAFLQIIAPVPIVAYADPKGQGMFKKWVKQCVSTYLDLFIRLVAVFFAIFIISNMSQAKISSDGESIIQNGLVYVFLILGTLLFAKQLPKLLSDITGAKFDGGFTLNPMKKLGESPFAAAAVGGVAGAAGGLAMNTLALGKNIKKDGWKKTFAGKDANGNLNKGFSAFKHGAGTLFSGAGGAFSAGSRGIYGGLMGKGKDGVNKLTRDAVTGASKARNLRSQGFSTRDKFENYLTDIGQMDYKTGTTNKYEDQIKQIGYDLANAQEEERAASQAAQYFAANSKLGSDLGMMFKRSTTLNKDGIPEYKYETNMRDSNGNLVTYTDLSIDDVINQARNSGYYNQMELSEIEKYAGHLRNRDYYNVREAELSKKQSKIQKGLDSSSGKK